MPKINLLDGATGTMLQKHGMPADACPPLWVRNNPAPLRDIQRQYKEAGSDIVCSPTFGANRAYLKSRNS